VAKFKEPANTVKAYKMFRVDPKQPGKLFPLFVDPYTPVPMNEWMEAKEGEMSNGKVKSKIGPLAYRPGWHAGDLPLATHIGDKDEEQKAEVARINQLRDSMVADLGYDKEAQKIAKKMFPYPAWVNAPRLRNPRHIWAEIEMPHDVDWQSEATKRGYNDQGKFIAGQAHITDQIPKGGHYRYKTNSNMTGNWLIGGAMKVNRILDDKEVSAINKEAGTADLPRLAPMKKEKFGFAGGGTVAPDEWKAEEHVNYGKPPVHMNKGGNLTVEEMRRAIAKASGSNPPMAEKNLTTLQDFHTSLGDNIRAKVKEAQDQMNSWNYKYDKGHRVFTEDSAKKNRAPYEILERHRHGNQLMWEGEPWRSKKIIDPETGKAKRTPYEPAYRVRGEIGEMILPESAIKGRVDLANGGVVHLAVGGPDWKPHPENDLLQPIGSSKMVGEEKLVSDDGDFKSGLSMFPSRKKSYRYVYHGEDQTPIGAMQIATQGPRSKKAVIQNLYVAEASRRQGIASKLLDRARQDFDVSHSDDLTTAGRAFAKAKKAHGGRVTHAHHLDIEERPL